MLGNARLEPSKARRSASTRASTVPLGRYMTLIVALLTAGTAQRHTKAQCGAWLPGEGLAGVDGPVFAAATWDSDGPGPESAMLVVGGSFAVAGTSLASNIAAWNGTSWQQVGGGMNNTVRALTVYDGKLI